MAILVSSVLEYATLVATMMRVVLRSTGSSISTRPYGLPAARVFFRVATVSAKSDPSAVRAPATIFPVRPSTTSPAAFTTARAPITTSPRRRLAVPSPPFMPRSPCRCSMRPTVPPAPAPTFPSATGAAEAAWHALYADSGSGRMCASPTARSSMMAPTTSGMRTVGDPQSYPIFLSSRNRTAPATAPSPNTPPPESSMAWMRSTGLTGCNMTTSVSPGADPS